jgi:WD40 repeat protein
MNRLSATKIYLNLLIILALLLSACADNTPTAKPQPRGTTQPDAAAQATIIAALAATEAAQPYPQGEVGAVAQEEELPPTPTPNPSPVASTKIPNLATVATPSANPTSAKIIGQLGNVPGGITAAALSPDGNWLAIGNRNQFWLLEIATGKYQLYYTTYDNEERGAASISWAADGRKLAVGTFQGGANMWRWDGIENKLRPGAARLRPTEGSGNFGDQLEVSFSPDGKMIAGLGSEGVLTIWDSEFYTTLFKFNADFAGFMAWSPDSKMLIDEYLKLHSLTTGASTTASGNARISGEKPQGVAWSPDGKTIAVTAEDFKLARFQAPTLNSLLVGKLLGRADYDNNTQIIRDSFKLGKRITFSPDSRWLALANTPTTGKISLWNATTGQPLFEINTANKALNVLSWPLPGVLMAAGDDGVLRLWQIS